MGGTIKGVGMFGGNFSAMSLLILGGIMLLVVGVIVLVGFFKGTLGLGTIVKAAIGCAIVFALFFVASFFFNMNVSGLLPIWTV